MSEERQGNVIVRTLTMEDRNRIVCDWAKYWRGRELQRVENLRTMLAHADDPDYRGSHAPTNPRTSELALIQADCVSTALGDWISIMEDTK